MPYTQNGIFYKYLNPASPKVVVFFHGLGSSLNYYYLIASALSANYGCLLLDNPGSGRSAVPEESLTIKEIGSLGLLVIEELGIADKQFVLVGHSYSGMVVNYLTAKHADGIQIAASVLISPLHPLKSVKPAFEDRIAQIRKTNTMEAVADAVAANAPGLKCSGLKKAFIRELISGQTPRGYIDNCGALVSACSHEEEFKEYYEKISVPVLLILGEDDKTTPFATNVKYIANGLKTKEIVTLKGVGHWAALEDDENVLAAMKHFLQSVGF